MIPILPFFILFVLKRLLLILFVSHISDITHQSTMTSVPPTLVPELNSDLSKSFTDLALIHFFCTAIKRLLLHVWNCHNRGI